MTVMTMPDDHALDLAEQALRLAARGVRRHQTVTARSDGQPAGHRGAAPGERSRPTSARRAPRAGRPCPCRPVPYPVALGSNPRPSSRTSNVEHRRHLGRARTVAALRLRVLRRRSAAPRGTRSTRPPRPPAGTGRRRRRATSTGTGDLARLRRERGRQALVGEQRRVDAAREVAQVLERLLRLRLDLGEHLRGLRGFPLGQRAREPSLHGERDELLLRAVVDVALQPAALLVLRRDQPLLRGLEVVQADFSSSVSRTLRSTSPACDARSAISFSSAGRRGRSRGLRTASAPSTSPACSTAYTRSTSRDRDGRPVRQRHGRRRRGASSGQAATWRSSLPDREPDVAPLGPDPLAEHARHPRQDVVVGVGRRPPARRSRSGPRTASRACRRRAGWRTG